MLENNSPIYIERMSYVYENLENYTQLNPNDMYYFTDGNHQVFGKFLGMEDGLVKVRRLGAGTEYFNKDRTRFTKRIYVPEGQVVSAPVPAPVPAPSPSPARKFVMPEMNIPPCPTNTITGEEIKHGDIMVNFHGERDLETPRYYKMTTFNKLNPRINPYSRKPIELTNVKVYKAKLEGGKRKTKKTRKAKKTRRHGKK